MRKKVFIDGQAGTTGLRIEERLSGREDIERILLPEEQRKDPEARREALNRADIAFLCLPDAAAREALAMVENPDTVLLDTSTAHRTDPAFAYGFPELSPAHEEAVRRSKRIAVPGCHASGFIALIYPLIEEGLLSPDCLLSCYSLTGYSGGGKKMIAEYQAPDRSPLLDAPRLYGLSLNHKHLPEMQKISGLACPPLFCPVVADFYSGMLVTVPLPRALLAHGAGLREVAAVYARRYTGPVVRFCGELAEDGFLSAAALSGKDSMQILLQGNEERLLLLARYDNLGKGASGAAVECLNLLLGCDPAYRLVL